MGRLGSTGVGRKTPGVSKQISGKHWLPGYEAHGTMSRGWGTGQVLGRRPDLGVWFHHFK